MIRVTIPAYNEEGAIRDLIEDLDRVLRERPEGYRVLVVDDGSTDATAAILQECAQHLPIDLIRHEVNRNLGGAMRTGLRAVAAAAAPEDIVVTMDADNTHPPDRIAGMLQAIHAGADVVVASRYVKGGGTVGVPWYRNLLSLGANYLFRSFFPIAGVREYTGSFRAIRAKVLQEAIAAWGDDFIGEDGFTCMPEILVHLRGLGFRFGEVPLVIRYDMKVGASKMRLARNIFGSLALMWRLRRHTSPPRRDRIAIVSVPWTASPPRTTGSIGHISHDIARRLLPRHEVMLVSGAHRVDHDALVPGIRYVRLSDNLDRLLLQVPATLLARFLPGGKGRLYLYRSCYHRIFAWRAARALRRFHPAVVLLQFLPQWLPSLRKQLPGTRLLLWMQADTLSRGPETLTRPLGLARFILSCGEHLTQTTRESLPHLAECCRTLFNGFDPELFRALADRDNGTPRERAAEILYVGRVTPEKGVHVLVRAVARLAEEGRDVRLSVVGMLRSTDPRMLPCLREDLRAELVRLGPRYLSFLQEEAGPARDRVQYVGEVEQKELPALYRRATVFVHPTLWDEPFGMPVVEAMASGTPAVAGRAGAMPEIIEDGVSGLLFPPGDSDALAACLREIFDDPKRARELGEAGRQRALDHFTWDRTAQTFEGIVSEVLAIEGAARRGSVAVSAGG
ncbi:MAG: glycosyltransferase [Planctomycetota bacterium]